MTAETTGAAATEVGDDLEFGMRGRLVRPTDGDYHEARLTSSPRTVS